MGVVVGREWRVVDGEVGGGEGVYEGEWEGLGRRVGEG